MAESAPNVGAAQRISWPHRLAAILFADLSAALFYAISLFVGLRLGHGIRASMGESLEFLLLRQLPAFFLMFLVVGAAPSLAVVWLMLRKSFPSLLVAISLGAAVGCCVCFILIAAFVFSNLAPVRTVVLIGLLGGLPFALPAGAIGGAVAWRYLSHVRRRQSGAVALS